MPNWRISATTRSIVALVASLCSSDLIAQEQPGSLESAIKATYLYKFVPFVEWPAKALPSQQAPITICVAGGGPVSQVIDSEAAGKIVGGRAVTVRHIVAGADAHDCSVLFASEDDPDSIARTFAPVRDAPVLTVSDSIQNAQHGVISFVLIDDHVRFDIDTALAAHKGLTISSKLLALAHQVFGLEDGTR